jgi:hypothetical protein
MASHFTLILGVARNGIDASWLANSLLRAFTCSKKLLRHIVNLKAGKVWGVDDRLVEFHGKPIRCPCGYVCVGDDYA